MPTRPQPRHAPEGATLRPGEHPTTPTAARSHRPATTVISIAHRLQPRDLTLALLLDQHQLLTTDQITAILFGSPVTAIHRLRALRRISFIDRLIRHQPGTPALTCWIPGALSARYAALADGRPPPTTKALRDAQDRILANPQTGHLIGANQFHINLLAHARAHPDTRLARWWSARRTTAAFAGKIQPDGHGIWTTAGGQVGYWLEHDQSSEDHGRLIGKLASYRRLRAQGGPCYPVLFWLGSRRRGQRRWQQPRRPGVAAVRQRPPPPHPGRATQPLRKAGRIAQPAADGAGRPAVPAALKQQQRHQPPTQQPRSPPNTQDRHPTASSTAAPPPGRSAATDSTRRHRPPAPPPARSKLHTTTAATGRARRARPALCPTRRRLSPPARLPACPRPTSAGHLSRPRALSPATQQEGGHRRAHIAHRDRLPSGRHPTRRRARARERHTGPARVHPRRHPGALHHHRSPSRTGTDPAAQRRRRGRTHPAAGPVPHAHPRPARRPPALADLAPGRCRHPQCETVLALRAAPPRQPRAVPARTRPTGVPVPTAGPRDDHPQRRPRPTLPAAHRTARSPASRGAGVRHPRLAASRTPGRHVHHRQLVDTRHRAAHRRHRIPAHHQPAPRPRPPRRDPARPGRPDHRLNHP